MYFADHNPPHFHVLGRDGAAQVAIDSLEVIAVSGRVDLREALGWAAANRALLQAKMERVERIMIGKITSVAVIGDKRLELAWDDGVVAPVDLKEVVAAHKGLAPLSKKSEFARVAVSGDGWSLEWPCGVDFGAPQLRRWADEQAGETMRVEDFRAWMDEHGLTQEAAAQALGLSRRMIAYYLSGEKVIPKTVMLATEGWARRVEA
jgi:hypothetical protein